MGQSSPTNDVSGSVSDGKPVGTWPTVCTPRSLSPNRLVAAMAMATVTSGAGARGMNRSSTRSRPNVIAPTAAVAIDSCVKP
ncbi:hypothetical protein D3C72_2133690 [compost metagenome]